MSTVQEAEAALVEAIAAEMKAEKEKEIEEVAALVAEAAPAEPVTPEEPQPKVAIGVDECGRVVYR